jgi:hypothetical protein
MNRIIRFIIIGIAVFGFSTLAFGARVEKDDGKVYIVDQHGERWNVTQAETLGFEPRKFQYGIGRHAFKTLDDSDLAEHNRWVYDNTRVIGIAGGGEAKAFSVRKLAGHEIANSIIGQTAVAVGY